MSRDPVGYVKNMHLYLYGRSSPVRFRDPTGMIDVGRITSQNETDDYTSADVAFCKQKLTLVANGAAIGLPEWAGLPALDCAGTLLRMFLGMQPPQQCPTVCKSAVEQEVTLGSTYHDQLNSGLKHFFGNLECGSRGHSLEPMAVTSEFKKNVNMDLYYAIKKFTFKDDKAFVHYFCGEADADGCCCCTVDAAFYEGYIDDKYNFLENEELVGSRRSLAWCGGVLEKEGIGRPFDVRCPVRPFYLERSFKKCEVTG